MRVLLKRRQRDERGAIAVITALMVVVLFGLAAFSVDLGMAYASKRQLQTSSDAAALAAAGVYAAYPGTCATLVGNAAARVAAQQAADKYGEANRPGAAVHPIEVACSADGALWVTVRSQASTDTVFAPVIGGPDKITTERVASAAVEVSPHAGSGFRPMAVCSADLPAGGQITGIPVRINSPGDGGAATAGCPSPPPGNWWTLDCPEERTGSTGSLEQQIKDGCSEPVSIVEGQADTTNLQLLLTGECPSAPAHSENCLSGDPGQLDSGHIEDSWKYLIDQGTKIVLPVFLPNTVSGSGTNATFPVYKLAGMVVCGYHFGKNVKYSGTNAACAASPYDITGDGSKDNYLVVVYTTVMASGGNEPNHCAIGNTACDGGVRRVRITQ